MHSMLPKETIDALYKIPVAYRKSKIHFIQALFRNICLFYRYTTTSKF
uniref:Uncharacterized protein n=1 Tax=Ciona intestinalis TaxID=7719 RepID=H2XY91_CIOIN